MLNITGTIVVHCENQHKYNNKKRAVSIKDKTLTNKMLTYLNKDLYDETNLKQKHKKRLLQINKAENRNRLWVMHEAWQQQRSITQQT